MRKGKFWKRGSAESFAFICLAPVIIILFALLVSVVQAGSFKEKLEYTTYVAARAAVVSDSKDIKEAQKAAKQAAEADLASYGADFTDLKVKLSYVYGSVWKKGNYVKCEVSVKFHGLTTLVNSRKKFSLVMAIEKTENSVEDSQKGGT